MEICTILIPAQATKSEKGYTCPECNGFFKKATWFRRHQLRHHSAEPVQRKRKLSQSEDDASDNPIDGSSAFLGKKSYDTVRNIPFPHLLPRPVPTSVKSSDIVSNIPFPHLLPATVPLRPSMEPSSIEPSSIQLSSIEPSSTEQRSSIEQSSTELSSIEQSSTEPSSIKPPSIKPPSIELSSVEPTVEGMFAWPQRNFSVKHAVSDSDDTQLV